MKDLPKSKMGVDIENDFEPEYEVIKGKAKVLADIKKAAQERRHASSSPPTPIARARPSPGTSPRRSTPTATNVCRVLFNEITKKAIQKAIAQPRELDQKKYDSQQARRILDRLVGYQISPILWKKVRRGLSAGRVQSVAVRLVVRARARDQGVRARGVLDARGATSAARAAARVPRAAGEGRTARRPS